MSGVWQYANLRKQGVLTSSEVAGNGWFRAFDEASQTPWVYKQDTGAFYSDYPISKVTYPLSSDAIYNLYSLFSLLIFI